MHIMGKDRDLRATERARIVHSKIKQFWNYEKKQINYGKVIAIVQEAIHSVWHTVQLIKEEAHCR